MNSRDIERLLSNLDQDARKVFSVLPREDQLLIIFSMEMTNSNRLAVVEKRQIDFEKETREYREKRERREDSSDDGIMNTTQKILKAIADQKAKEFDFWQWFRDRVAPTLLVTIILGILYLVFGGHLP